MAPVSQPGAGRWLAPMVLEGRHVRLEPLTLDHVEQLWAAAQDDEVWRWLSVRRPATVPDMGTLVEAALAEQVRGERLPWAIVDRASEQAVGSTSYLDVTPAHRRLEIGWTWLGRAWWRTPINTAAKLLLLGHAFDDLGAHRVAFQTDSANLRSQAAIERMGGVPGGRPAGPQDPVGRQPAGFGVLQRATQRMAHGAPALGGPAHELAGGPAFKHVDDPSSRWPGRTRRPTFRRPR